MIVLKGSSYSKAFFLEFSDYVVKLTNLRRVNTNDIFVGRGKDEIPESLHVYIFY
jgi:Ran GTPase-activating protein 1